ncbi:MAG: hypothetical protein ABFD91_15050 [Anaerohalosphaeraceae bacterium]
MSSAKQIEANRLNAKKSTGPKTPAGKARSSRNAFIHGLSSQRPTVTIENSAEFNAFANKFMDQYEPLEPSEIFLVRRIACMAWRIQRAQCYETLVLDNLCCSIPEDDSRTDQEVFSQLLLDDFRNHQTLAKLQRYETQLERSILRCMKELRDSRKASDANYTDAAYYLRDGQPREDYKDLVTPYGKESPNEPNPDNQQSSLDNQESTIRPNPQSSIENQESLNESNLDRRACVEQQDPVDSRGTEAGSACLDGLTNPNLPWIPAENKVYKTENQRIRNNPNKEKWNYDYAPDWYIRVLDAVHFSPKKRKTMTDRDLEKNASCIVHTFQNPEQFLLDIHAITLRQKPIEPNLDNLQSSIENRELPNEPNFENHYELCEV